MVFTEMTLAERANYCLNIYRPVKESVPKCVTTSTMFSLRFHLLRSLPGL